MELIRAAIRRHKNRNAETITEAAIASDAKVDAGDASNAYKKAVKRQGKAYLKEFKKDKKSKKSSKKYGKKSYAFETKSKKKSKKDKKSSGKVLSLYDIARDAEVA